MRMRGSQDPLTLTPFFLAFELVYGIALEISHQPISAHGMGKFSTHFSLILYSKDIGGNAPDK